MIETPGVLWSVLFFILALAPLVFVHELGHYLVGRWFGVKAEVFSIGFGRKIFGWTDKRGTDWRVGWMPLGGYVRFAGDMGPSSAPDPAWEKLPAAEREGVFHAKPLWQRALIVFAGPATNFILAMIILAGFALVYGQSVTPPVIAQVQPNSPAQRAGMISGDRIISVNGREIDSFNQLSALVQDRPDSDLAIVISRGQKNIILPVRSATALERDRFGNEYKLGRIGIASGKPEQRDVSFFEAPVIAARETVSIVDRMISGLWQIISGRRPVKDLGGPIKIAQISGQAATLGLPSYLHFLALISINLGFINLLPIPMLDGGHLTFYAAEAIRRRPISPRVVELAFRSGLFLVLGLMIFVTLNDLGSLGVWDRITSLLG